MEVVYSSTPSRGSALERIEADRVSGRITPPEAVYYQALAAFSPQDLPAVYQPVGEIPLKCATEVVFRARKFWAALDEGQRSRLLTFLSRPVLPFSYVSPSGLFRIHYASYDTITIDRSAFTEWKLWRDEDHTGIPDYAEKTAEFLEWAYHLLVEVMGWRPPPPDPVDGPEWDVYLENLTNTYGWTTPDVRIGVNPDRYTAFIRLDDDYIHTPTRGLDGLAVTTAHEFFHVVQMGYVYRDDDGDGVAEDQFLMEAASTWFEDVAHDAINDYLNYLHAFFKRTNVRFDYSDGWREYGLSLWFHFLDKRYPGVDIVRRTWEALVEASALPALRALLGTLGTRFGRQLALFYGWNYFTGSRADTVRFYDEGHLYPEISVDGRFTFTQDTVLEVSVRPTAARYYEFRSLPGTTYILIPVNLGEPEMVTGRCSIPLLQREETFPYTMLASGVVTALFPHESLSWELPVVVGDPQGFYRLMVINTSVMDRYGTISGLVWHDRNRDGRWDALDEEGIPEVALTLTGPGPDGRFGTPDDTPLLPAITQSDGRYRFVGLEGGEYRIAVRLGSLPVGYVLTRGQPSRHVFLQEGETVDTVHFGFATIDWYPAAFPQPFLPTLHDGVQMPFFIPDAATVRMAIYTLSGFFVCDQTLYFSEGGTYAFRWDGRDSQGKVVPGGIYFYVIEKGGTVVSREKIAVVR